MIYKIIPNMKDKYCASDDGDIYRLVNRQGYSLIKPMKLPSRTNRNGYPVVTLYLEGKSITKTIHKLVMESLIGLSHGLDVNHIDGNKLNNRLSNLEYVTRSENVRHAYAIGLKNPIYGIDNTESKLSTGQVIEVKMQGMFCHKYKGKYSYGYISALADRFCVSKTTISDILNGRKWKNVNVYERSPSIG